MSGADAFDRHRLSTDLIALQADLDRFRSWVSIMSAVGEGCGEPLVGIVADHVVRMADDAAKSLQDIRRLVSQ